LKGPDDTSLTPRPCCCAAADAHKKSATSAAASTLFDFDLRPKDFSPSANIFANNARAGKRARAHTYTRERAPAFKN
jgi:hypothetical protein